MMDNKNNLIHPTATIDEKVRYGKNNRFLVNCVIGSISVAYDGYRPVDHKYGVVIGDNCHFHTGSIICLGLERDTVIKNNFIIGQLSIIGHDCLIHSNVRIMNSCTVAGFCEIKSDVYIGLGAVIRNRVTIGRNTIIGMGSVVTKDIPDNVVAYGNPCKVVKKNENDLKSVLRGVKTGLENLV